MSFKEAVRGTKRFGQFVRVLIKHESLYLIQNDLSIWKKNKKTEPATLRIIMEEMGGGFIKLGQLLSLRPDLIPHRYCDEFSKLQDNVKPFDFENAKNIIEKSTGSKLNSVFSEFSKKPIASASVGQVYKARLKSGELVAVKVKRPDADDMFERDISLMESAAKLAKNIHGMDFIDPEGIVEEFKAYTKEELNYINERKKIDLFYSNLKNTGIKIPKTYPDLCSENVLVMEFIEGHSLKKLFAHRESKEYKKRIAKEIFNSFLKQILVDGEFHADPHPSNILITPKGKEKIALLDFGITGSLTPIMKSNIVKLFISLNSKDVEGVITAMMHMNMVSSNDAEVRKDMHDMLSPYYGMGLRKIDFPKLFLQSIKVAKKHKIKVPKDYVLLGKTVFTIESICMELYPEFNFVEESKPFVTKLVLHEYAPSKFIAKQIVRAEHAGIIIKEIPEIVSRIFRGNEQENKKVEELSSQLIMAEHRIDILIEKMILMFTTFILIFAGVMMLKLYPSKNGVSIFSVFAFCIAAATFILAVLLKSKKN